MKDKMLRFIRTFNIALLFILFGIASLYILYPLPIEGNISVRVKSWLVREFDTTEYNRLYIPKIGVNMKVLEGDFSTSILRGGWKDPTTSTPDLGGNTVIAAHRFLYTSGPDTFYRLDELSIDDEISVTWEGEEYSYRVYSTGIVSKHSIEILKDNGDNILTLYTCHPLWTSDNRLIVRAVLV